MGNLIKLPIICVISFALTALSMVVQSHFIDDVIFNSAFIISIAIFAIHASSSAILISQLNILNRQFKINFLSTLVSIKNSLIEDALLIFGIFFVSIAHGGTFFVEYSHVINSIMSFLLLALLVAQLWIIYDTLIAVLSAFKFDDS